MNILFADADVAMIDTFVTLLVKRQLCQVYCASTRSQVEDQWIEHRPEIVILDRPFLDMLKQLRKVHDAIVLIIAQGKDVEDEILCLNAGADDYLHKPFFPRQLLARIDALGRRKRLTLKPRLPFITVGPIQLDLIQDKVTVDGTTSQLTPTESKLLQMLAVNKNEVCTLEEIVSSLWGYHDHNANGLVKVHVRSLRKKIEQNPSQPRYIVTKPREGYCLRV